MILKKLTLIASALAFVLIAGPSASAFMQNYGDFNGTTVMYLQVTESNTDVIPFFGAPAIVGDTLDFDPVNFKVQSSGVQGGQGKDGQLNFTIMDNDGVGGIPNVIINESGDFTLNGFGPQLAQASVGTSVNFSVTHVNGVMLGAPCTQNGVRMVFMPTGTGNNGNPVGPQGGEYQLPGDAGTATPWSGMLNYDVAALLASCGVQGLATKIEVSLDNTLTANSANGGFAFIAKKDFNGVVVNVPEPGFAPIACLVIGAMLMIRRRFVAQS